MLIGSMVVISRWFPPDRFSTLSAMVLFIGLFGNLIATTPLAWATELFGWRIVSGAAVVFTALATVAVWLVVRDAPPGHPFLARTPERPGQMLLGLMEILRNRFLWPILALNFCNYACTFTVQGLWGGPFLREVHGLSPIEAGNVLLLAVVTYQVGMLAFGPLDRLLDTRKWIAIGGSLVIVALLAILSACVPPAGLGRRGRHPSHRLFQRVEHHGHDARARRLSGPADRPRDFHDQHGGDARGRRHAVAIRDYHRSIRAAPGRRPHRDRLSRPVRRADRGAAPCGRHLQPLQGRQAQRPAAPRLRRLDAPGGAGTLALDLARATAACCEARFLSAEQLHAP